MKQFRSSFLAFVAILSLICTVPASAGPNVYNVQVSVTSTNSVVTPTAGYGKPKSITVLNDGATAVYLDLDRVAVAASATAIKIKACAGVILNVDEFPVTFLGLITASGTSSVQVYTHYMSGSPGGGLGPMVPTGDRIVPIANPGCTTDTGLTTTNGASLLPYAETESITLDTGALTTDSSANLLHENSIIDVVVCRQTIAITTSTAWGLGDPTTANRFSVATPIATTTIVGLAHMFGVVSTTATGPTQASAAKLRITSTVANPGAGVVRCTVFGRTATAPAS